MPPESRHYKRSRREQRRSEGTIRKRRRSEDDLPDRRYRSRSPSSSPYSSPRGRRARYRRDYSSDSYDSDSSDDRRYRSRGRRTSRRYSSESSESVSSDDEHDRRTRRRDSYSPSPRSTYKRKRSISPSRKRQSRYGKSNNYYRRESRRDHHSPDREYDRRYRRERSRSREKDRDHNLNDRNRFRYRDNERSYRQTPQTRRESPQRMGSHHERTDTDRPNSSHYRSRLEKKGPDTDVLRRKEALGSSTHDRRNVPKDRSWLEPEKGVDGKEESIWKRRRRMRETGTCASIWGSSPPPPNRLEDRFEVGADERRKRERKRRRKEERRLRREARRAKKNIDNNPSIPSVEKDIIKDVPDIKETEEKKIEEDIKNETDTSDEEVIGPNITSTGVDKKEKQDYGKALRQGEGSKMAAFIKDGSRIPRRGEIGLTSNQISAYETQGYVMSGSRHRQMEAVRLRKENQVYSAEELAALRQYNREEKKIREEKMLNQFRMLAESKLGTQKFDDNKKEESTK